MWIAESKTGLFFFLCAVLQKHCYRRLFLKSVVGLTEYKDVGKTGEERVLGQWRDLVYGQNQ